MSPINPYQSTWGSGGRPGGRRARGRHRDVPCHAARHRRANGVRVGDFRVGHGAVPWFLEAASHRRNPRFDLGIHLTLTSEWPHYRWGPLSCHDEGSGLLTTRSFPQHDRRGAPTGEERGRPGRDASPDRPGYPIGHRPFTYRQSHAGGTVRGIPRDLSPGWRERGYPLHVRAISGTPPRRGTGSDVGAPSGRIWANRPRSLPDRDAEGRRRGPPGFVADVFDRLPPGPLRVPFTPRSTPQSSEHDRRLARSGGRLRGSSASLPCETISATLNPPDLVSADSRRDAPSTAGGLAGYPAGRSRPNTLRRRQAR